MVHLGEPYQPDYDTEPLIEEAFNPQKGALIIGASGVIPPTREGIPSVNFEVSELSGIDAGPYCANDRRAVMKVSGPLRLTESRDQMGTAHWLGIGGFSETEALYHGGKLAMMMSESRRLGFDRFSYLGINPLGIGHPDYLIDQEQMSHNSMQVAQRDVLLQMRRLLPQFENGSWYLLLRSLGEQYGYGALSVILEEMAQQRCRLGAVVPECGCPGTLADFGNWDTLTQIGWRKLWDSTVAAWKTGRVMQIPHAENVAIMGGEAADPHDAVHYTYHTRTRQGGPARAFQEAALKPPNWLKKLMAQAERDGLANELRQTPWVRLEGEMDPLLQEKRIAKQAARRERFGLIAETLHELPGATHIPPVLFDHMDEDYIQAFAIGVRQAMLLDLIRQGKGGVDQVH